MAGDAGTGVTGAADLAARVGRRVRRRRSELGLTLSDVSSRAGVSDSHLSAIETGASLPSLAILARVVAAVDLSLHEVLQDVAVAAVRTGELDDGSHGVQRASHDDLRLRVAFVVARPGEEGPSPVPVEASEVFVYVLSGGLTVTVDGVPYDLDSGDSLDTDPAATITWHVPATGSSVSLWASAPGDTGPRNGWTP